MFTKRLNEFPLKSSENLLFENLWFSDDFRENKYKLIRKNSLNVRSEIWRKSLKINVQEFFAAICEVSQFLLIRDI